jgi:hypothetical protein
MMMMMIMMMHLCTYMCLDINCYSKSYNHTLPSHKQEIWTKLSWLKCTAMWYGEKRPELLHGECTSKLCMSAMLTYCNKHMEDKGWTLVSMNYSMTLEFKFQLLARKEGF